VSEDVAHRHAVLPPARGVAQTYSDALKRAAELHRVLVEKYIQAVGLSAGEAAVLLQHCARDRWCAALLRQALEKREVLVLLRDEVPTRRRSYGGAMKRTADERRAFKILEQSAPSVWRPLTRRQWAERRRDQRARVSDAEAAERIARKACGTAATDDVKVRGRAHCGLSFEASRTNGGDCFRRGRASPRHTSKTN
jgi:hypothetical protein